jgi:hypothetical protein
MALWLQSGAAVFAVILFYLVMWSWYGKDPKPGTIVAQYEPPRGLSPALMRYAWKQRFDERVIWSDLLSLVFRGLAVLDKKPDATYIRPLWPPKRRPALPKEEFALYDELATARGRNGVRLSLLDDTMAQMAVRMAVTLRSTNQGLWFVENRKVVLAGSALSGLALLLTAKPVSWEQLVTLLLPSMLIAVGSFYSYFVIQRILELLRVSREHPTVSVLKRLLMMMLLELPSACAIGFGAMILGVEFGWLLVATAAVLTAVNLLFLYLMKAPTKQGCKLIDEIEGFRHFLSFVERLPMDLPNAPARKLGLYEEYLPYALALEVEQQWCDQTAAIASSDHDLSDLGEGLGHMVHIGMWDGRPVEIAYYPKNK